jgi:hypothetical protein
MTMRLTRVARTATVCWGVALGACSAQTPLTPTTEPATNVNATCAAAPTAWIWCDDFESDRRARYFEYDSAGGAFVRTANVGVNGSFGMRAHFAAGAVSVGALRVAFGRVPTTAFRPVDAGVTAYRDVYWRMFVKTQAGWIGGGGDKLSRATSLVSVGWSQAMIAHVWSGVGALDTHLIVDPASGTDAAGTLQTTQYNDFTHLRWLGSAPSSTALFDAMRAGQWHCVEAHARLNDSGTSNGVQELWIDGAAEAQRTGLNFVGAYSAYGINAVFFENYWNAGSPVAQDRFFDGLVVSTQRIGC